MVGERIMREPPGSPPPAAGQPGNQKCGGFLQRMSTSWGCLLFTIALLVAIDEVPSLFVKCEDWNTTKFFSAATARKVRGVHSGGRGRKRAIPF